MPPGQAGRRAAMAHCTRGSGPCTRSLLPRLAAAGQEITGLPMSHGVGLSGAWSPPPPVAGSRPGAVWSDKSHSPQVLSYQKNLLLRLNKHNPINEAIYSLLSNSLSTSKWRYTALFIITLLCLVYRIPNEDIAFTKILKNCPFFPLLLWYMQLQKGIREWKDVLQVPYEVKIIISPLLFLLLRTDTSTAHTHDVKSLKYRPRQTSGDHLIHPCLKDLPERSLFNLFSKPATNRHLLVTPSHPSYSCTVFLGLKPKPILLQFKNVIYCLTLHSHGGEILLYVPLKNKLLPSLRIINFLSFTFMPSLRCDFSPIILSYLHIYSLFFPPLFPPP